MSLKKFTAVQTVATGVTYELPDEFGLLVAVAIKSSADTTVQVAVADYAGFNIVQFASGDYTTRTVKRTGPLETDIFDSGGDPSANLEHTPIGVVFNGPLTVTLTGLGSGEFVIEFFYRPLQQLSFTFTPTTLVQSLNLPDLGFGVLNAIGLSSSSDTSVSLALVDGNSRTIATVASANYTSGGRVYTADLETDVIDVTNDPSADTEGNEVGIFFEKSITATCAGLAAGTFTADLYFEQ